ncbi:HSF-type DNA-binding-domain-containing protein [Lentinula edodes]|nr:HSF-type DNA-binding-domain-containing protein [Lentinula edodes]
MNSRSRHSNDLSLPLPEYHQQYNSSPLPPITSPPLLPPSQNLWGPSIHRTSNSRDEIHPQVTHHQPPLLPRLDHHPQIKREQRDSLPYHNQQPVPPTMEDSMPSTSDFVKKLYKMLEDQSFQDVVSWGPHGDCFVVKDMNEFTKSILPRMFKHSNFASFVRQLNKYDFHKVKNTDDNAFGEHSWTFRHPDFHADRRDALENIKRKVPASRKSQGAQNAASTTRPMEYHTQQLQTQVDRLTASHDELSSHIRSLERNIGNLERNLGGLERNYHEVLVEMVGFQRNMAQQDSVMQGLIEWVLHGGGAGGEGMSSLSTSSPPATVTLSNENPFIHSSVAQNLIGPSYRSYNENGGSNPINPMGTSGINDSVGRSALMKMNEMSRRAGDALNPNGNPSGGNAFSFGDGGDRPPSRLWTAATNAGLINPDGSFVNPLNNTVPVSSPNPDAWNNVASVGPTKITSRRDALAKIEELQRMRPASAGFLSNAAAKLVSAMETFGSNGENRNVPVQEGSQDNSMDSGSSITDMSNEEVVMPSASTVAANAEQEQEQRSQESQSNSSDPWNMMLPNVPSLSSFGSQDGSASLQIQQEQPSTPLHEGLQVYTVGHLMPRNTIDDMNGTWSFDPGMFEGGGFNFSGNTMVGGQERKVDGGSPTMASSSQVFDPLPSSSSSPPSGPDSSSKKLRVRRSAFVPGWAVSPRVLLVDDDAVSRKLGSKFLQVFGCKIDVAVDGVSAVNKMNLEKYDLVLMDIVMPKLDGVSATSLIRKFDHMTPIISMTSNSKPNEIMTYYHSGMNDILPKPFTRQGLLDMLEKHLMHLKVIQQMSRVPRSLGIPPLSDSGFEEAITSQAALLTRQNVNMASTSNSNELSNSNSALSLPSSTDMQPSSSSYSFTPLTMGADDDDMDRLNPLAGMGLSDDQYNAILNGIVNGESFSGSMDMGGYGNDSPLTRVDSQKRRLDDQDDGRDGKRSRFEVIE